MGLKLLNPMIISNDRLHEAYLKHIWVWVDLLSREGWIFLFLALSLQNLSIITMGSVFLGEKHTLEHTPKSLDIPWSTHTASAWPLLIFWENSFHTKKQGSNTSNSLKEHRKPLFACLRITKKSKFKLLGYEMGLDGRDRANSIDNLKCAVLQNHIPYENSVRTANKFRQIIKHVML